jgi:HPt (histidine-containing phosphotransfer) domain-containing protein
LRDSADGDPEEMQTLATLYLEQADELMPMLAGAVSKGSPSELNSIAHKLAGASASCGMIALVPLLRELEQMGRSGDLNGAAEAHDRVVATLGRTRHFIEQHLSAAVTEPAAAEL